MTNNKRVLALFLGAISQVQAVCQSNAIILPGSGCSTCSASMIPDANQVSCVPKGQCQIVKNQINTPNGKCGECLVCEEPNSTFTHCQQVTNHATCIAALRLPSAHTCPSSQYQAINGSCQTCPVGKHPDATQLTCVPTGGCHGVNTNQINIVQNNGIAICQQCPTCQEAYQPFGQKCVNVANYNQCLATQGSNACAIQSKYLATDGTCQSCPNCHVPDGTGLGCKPEPNFFQCMATKCDFSTQIWDINGNCTTCKACEKPDSTNTKCNVDPTCAQTATPTACMSTQALINGKCETCPKCTTVNFSKTSCDQDPNYQQCMFQACDWGKSVLDAAGQCIPCPKCEEPNWNRTQCYKSNTYNTCMAPTPAPVAAAPTMWTPPTPTPTMWTPPAPTTPTTCPAGQVNANGMCAFCQPGSAPDAWGLSCVSTNYTQQAAYNPSYPSYTPVPQPPQPQKAVVQPVVKASNYNPYQRCAAGQVTQNGQCVQCTGGSMPDSYGTYCTCPAGSQMNTNGTCAVVQQQPYYNQQQQLGQQQYNQQYGYQSYYNFAEVEADEEEGN